MEQGKEKLKKALEAILPEIVLRHKVAEYTGGAVQPKTLANHDSAGTGPKKRYLINRHVAYHRDDFLDWLIPRIKRCPSLGKEVRHAS